MINLQEQLTEQIFATIEQAFATILDRSEPRYGWGAKSAGFPGGSGDTWVRIVARPVAEIHDRIWSGEECASVLLGVPKPSLLRSFRWIDSSTGIVWRADELTRAEGDVISQTSDVAAAPNLPTAWWAELRGGLTALSSFKTERVAARQDLITRRITQFTDVPIDPIVPEWRTAHGDLHWANLMGPRLTILDWEGWGVGPRGLDAASLWAYSLAVAPLAKQIHAEFATDLDTRSGWLARLFMCIELLRMVKNFGDHPSLEEPLANAAADLIRNPVAPV